ncbi:amidohydrolase [Brevibacterium sp. BDJS002]|uniref:amidohydrolase n=1 Tax=Brevibacterium sp. BDJS002 TaxID=3020906 RepID=UPI002307D82C|nr:amidohydrolase [Brevibacterium sp. BDJS002]WCE40804.1 amidohydrolase [Brevibacterium sp. BDJS002]
MNLDVLDVSIFDGDSVLPADRISIRDGIITEISTGTAADPADHTITATGKLITPGFVDAHVHTTFGGQESLACDLSEAQGLQASLDVIRSYLAATAESAAPGSWVTGGGWSMSDFPGGAPSAAILDELSPERPIILLSADHHSAWVNSKAMDLAGLDASTPTPPGGVIEKDESGTPTGCLHESAMDLVSVHVPDASDAEIRAGLLAGQSSLHAFGITAWMDAIVGDYSGHRSPFDAYLEAEDTGELTAEVVGSLWWPRDVEDIDAQVAALVRNRREQGQFRTTSVKFMLDGIVESRTAAMSSEYACPCGGFGTSYFTREHLHASFAALDAAGFDIHCHAIGDAANKAALDAFAAIGTSPDSAEPGTSDRRHHIAHVQVVDPVDIPRFAQLGITANLQALWACHDQQLLDLNLPYLGAERSTWLYPFRSFADAGTHLAMGSDWPVSTPNPWEAIHVAVNRSHPDAGDPAPLLPEQAIDLTTALRAYTSGSAHLLRSEVNGRIRTGQIANLALASADPFDLEPQRLAEVHNEMTIAGGRIVHDATTAERQS